MIENSSSNPSSEGMYFLPDIRQQQEFVSNLPTEVLDSLGVFTESGYRLESIEELAESMIRDIYDNPYDKHLLLAIGEPGSGKTIILQEMMVYLLQKRKELQQFARRKNHHYSTANFPWGVPFSIMPSQFREHGDYHKDSSLRPSKNRELKVAEDIYESAIWTWAKRATDRSSIKIGFGDISVVTGFYDEWSGHTLGMERGNRMLRHIAEKSGKFSNLPIRLHVVGVSAAPEVRQNSYENRMVITHEEPIDVLIRQLKKRGFHPVTSDLVAIKDYLTEGAPIDQMLLCYKDTDEVIANLIASGELRNPIDQGQDISSSSEYEYFQMKRHELIGQQLLPYVMRALSIPEDRGIVLDNRTVQESVHAYLAVATEQPFKRIIAEE